MLEIFETILNNNSHLKHRKHSLCRAHRNSLTFASYVQVTYNDLSILASMMFRNEDVNKDALAVWILRFENKDRTDQKD